MIINEVENFFGYLKGIIGFEMMIEFEEQVKWFEIDVCYGFIFKVDFIGLVYKCWMEDGYEIYVEMVIIVIGVFVKYFGLEFEQKYLLSGGGVFVCVVCDGFFYCGQEVVIVGVGDFVCEEVYYLFKLCKKVIMLVCFEKFCVFKIMEECVCYMLNIEIFMNVEIMEVIGDDVGVIGVLVKDKLIGEIYIIFCIGFFVVIGYKLNMDVFKDYI